MRTYIGPLFAMGLISALSVFRTVDVRAEGSGVCEDPAARIVELVNDRRQEAGLGGLIIDDKLSEAARVRAGEIARDFSHTRPDGEPGFTVLVDERILYTVCGENLAYGQRSPEEAVEAWMESQGHKENILDPSFQETGVGCYSYNGVVYWTQLFISRE